ncbi:hypothetical protein PRIPAC_77679, partial [Pristionchus pacificus]|uniref:G protein-coupled receptor n=1 Tax=Pristionchus pacificus TaxID=54126 RepID=A0A2A6CJK9_PRIPA
MRLEETDWQILRFAFFVIASVSFIGMIFNSLLFITTVRSSNLRSACNILIAFCAIFDFGHELLPEISLSAGVFCVCSIGLDRMLSTLPMFSIRLKRKWLYLTIHLLLIAIYSSYTLYLLVAYYEPQKLICGMPSAFHGVAVVKWNLALTFANVLSVIIYMITWFIVRRLGASAETRRLFRSICIVMVIDVAGLTITTLLANLLMAFDVRGAQFALHCVAGIGANSGIAFKGLVYYTT